MRYFLLRKALGCMLALLLVGAAAPAAADTTAFPEQPMLRVEAGAHTAPIQSISVDREERFLVTGSEDKTVRIWNASAGKELAVLLGHEGWVTSVSFSPDGTRFATASGDRTIRIWDADTGDCRAVLRTRYAVGSVGY